MKILKVLSLAADPTSITEDLTNFNKHITDANNIINELNKQNESNMKILQEAEKIMNSTPITQPTPETKSIIEKFIERGEYHTPQNTPNVSIFERITNGIEEFNKNTKGFFKAIDTIGYYLANPILIWNGFVGIAGVITLVVCGVCIILWITGLWKDSFKCGGITFVAYILIKLVDYLIK